MKTKDQGPPEAEQREGDTNLRIVVDPTTHRYIRLKAAEWDVSFRGAAQRILTIVAEKEERAAVALAS